MSTSFTGVKITGGVRAFQVVQQDRATGEGTINLHGLWRHDDARAIVQARVVSEADQSTIAPWQDARQPAAGEWTAAIERVPAGGPYRVETRLKLPDAPGEWGPHGDVVHHVGVGDLWVIAGQSNAAGYGRGAAFDPPELGVSVLRNDESWAVAAHPLNETTGSTHPNLEGSNPAHSPYLLFAKRLRAALGYPIGLVQTALGGSGVNAWDAGDGSVPAALYENLLHCVRLAGGAVRGVVWYQGESDADPDKAGTYEARFARFVDRLRVDLGTPDLPFVTAQLNRWTGPADDAKDRAWSRLREAQRRAARRPNVYVVPTVDLPLSDNIHTSPDGNLTLGDRKARLALDRVYGKGPPAPAPDARAATLSADRRSITVAFDGVATRLSFLGPAADDFRVEDEHGAARVDAVATPARDAVRLTLARPAIGAARVHLFFGINPPCNLKDAEANVPPLAFYDLEAGLE